MHHTNEDGIDLGPSKTNNTVALYVPKNKSG